MCTNKCYPHLHSFCTSARAVEAIFILVLWGSAYCIEEDVQFSLRDCILDPASWNLLHHKIFHGNGVSYSSTNLKMLIRCVLHYKQRCSSITSSVSTSLSLLILCNKESISNYYLQTKLVAWCQYNQRICSQNLVDNNVIIQCGAILMLFD